MVRTCPEPGRRRALLAVILSMSLAPPALAQRVKLDPEPRRQFVTITLDFQYQQPLKFKKYPLEQLAGAPLGKVQDPADPVDYRSRDGALSVDVLEYSRRTKGLGITVYPFGARNGAALAIRLNRETLPIIRFDIIGPGRVERYALTDGLATDLGIGVMVNDRSSGWGLGAHSFITGGYGRLTGERGDGRRYFAEGGGGVNVGPVGVDVAIKFAYNRLDDPRPHTFFTVPISIRGTLSF